MIYPHHSPEQWRQQQELEESRRWSSLQALARFAKLCQSANDREHLAHLRYEAGISEQELLKHISRKEAA